MPVALRWMLLIGVLASFGASFASPNFVVQAPTDEMARRIAETAEAERVRLAELWFGHALPDWGEPCPVSVKVGAHLGAGGNTKFRFSRGEVYGWRMEVQGSFERILDSVIPHEVNHTILACYFRRALPRWADEGMASLMEHESEKQRQVDLAQQLVNTGRRIPLRTLLSIREYPSDYDQMMALYAEGYALTDFLIQQAGRQRFLVFLNDAHHRGWDKAIESCYGRRSIEHLEQSWSSWVLAGCPRLKLPAGQLLAATGLPAGSEQSSIRSQSPDATAAVTSIGTTSTGSGRALANGELPEVLTAPDPRGAVAKPVGPVATASFSRDAGGNRNASDRATGHAANAEASVAASLVTPSAALTRPATNLSRPARASVVVQNVSNSSDELQPLELIPVPSPSPALQALEMESVPMSAVSNRSNLREAALRRPAETPAPRDSTRFLDWSRFPTRVR
jgi:hypothetical protein